MGKAYEQDGLFIYDDSERNILIDFDTKWRTSQAYNNDGDIADLTDYFRLVSSIDDFEATAKQALKLISF